MVAFLAARQAAGHRRVPGPRAMVPLLSYLREAGVVAAAQPSVTPLGALLGEYRIVAGPGTGPGGGHGAAL